MKKEIILEKVLQEFSEKLPEFSEGRINYSDSDKAPVLTCFVKYKDKILLLNRSAKVRTYRGMWNSVAGYLDEFIPLEEKARKELQEELGITADKVKKIKFGEPYEFNDKNIGKIWIIFPVLAELDKEPVIKLDWEHTEYKWIDPMDLKKFNVVPNLNETWARIKIKN